MVNEKKRLYFVIGILLLIILFFLYQNIELNNKLSKVLPKENISKENICDFNLVKYIVSGYSMEPLIKNGSEIYLKENYYKCNLPKKGDIIIYNSVTTKGDIVKMITALPGDIIRFDNSNMYVNGEILKNSRGNVYVFSKNEINLMSAYLQNQKLQDGSYFAFGDNLNNSIDSRNMGGLGLENIRGKIEIKN